MACIVATSKIWNLNLISNLEKRTSEQFIPIGLSKDLTKKLCLESNPKYIFFPHWSYKIPPEIYNNFKCVIFHMTDLPFGRGGSPLQNLIANGIYKTKISALQCVEEIDAGPIYLKKSFSLEGNAQEIYERATIIIEDMIVEILNNEIKPMPQEGDVVTFARRKPSDGNLGLLDNTKKVYDYIRMLDAENYPKAFLETQNLKFEFSNAELVGDEIRASVCIKPIKEKICQ